MTSVLPPAGTPGETWRIDCVIKSDGSQTLICPMLPGITKRVTSRGVSDALRLFRRDIVRIAARCPVTPPRAEGQDGGGP